MNFFKPVYDYILLGADWLVKVASADLFAFGFLALTLLVFVVGIFTMCYSKEAKTARKLVKVNNFLVKNQKAKDENFFANFNKIMLKGKDRLKNSYTSFLTSDEPKIANVFVDTRIQNGYTKKQNIVNKICIALSVLALFVFFGIYAKAGYTVTSALFKAMIFPILILIVDFVYSIVFMLYQKGNLNTIGDYSLALYEGAIPIFDGCEEQVEDLKKDFCEKYNLPYNPSRDEHANNFLKDEEVFVKDIAKLTAQKEQLEAEIEKEKQTLFASQQDIDQQINQGKWEIQNIKDEISKTDNPDKQEILEREQTSNEKLVEALEKLKANQTSSFERTESVLQKEIDRIDKELGNSKTKKEFDQQESFANFQPQEQVGPSNLKNFETGIAQTQQQAAEPVLDQFDKQEQNFDAQPQPLQNEQEKPETPEKPKKSANKNINDALNDLLSTMNKYKKKNTESEEN